MALYLRENDNTNTKSVAFVYCWTHIPTGKWYVGSRTAKGCHLSDGYICSSKEVKTMITENSKEWNRNIIATGESNDILNLESAILKKLDAKNHPMSFNRHNGDGKFTTLGRIEPEHIKEKRISKLKGMKKPDGFGEKIKKIRTGLKFDEQWRKNIGLASKGRLQSLEARKKNSESHMGEKNHFYGKTHTEETKQLIREKKTGKKSSSWKGYWASPLGEQFVTLNQAHEKYSEVTTNTLRLWCKNNKNGWSFRPSGISK